MLQIVQRVHQWRTAPPLWRAWLASLLFALAGFLGFALLLHGGRVGYQWMDARRQAQLEPLFPTAQGWRTSRAGIRYALALPSGCRVHFRVRLRTGGYDIGCPDGRVSPYLFPTSPVPGRLTPAPYPSPRSTRVRREDFLPISPAGHFCHPGRPRFDELAAGRILGCPFPTPPPAPASANFESDL